MDQRTKKSVLRPILSPILAAIMLFGAIGCPPAPKNTTIDDLFPPETRSITVSDTAIATGQPVDPSRVDLLETYRGMPGRVLAMGTVVERVYGTDKRASSSSSTRETHPFSPPWIPVEVMDSVDKGQIGWFGWVHMADLEPAPLGFTASEEISRREMASGRLKEPGFVCQWPDGSPEPGSKCEIALHPSLPIRVHGCDNGYVRVSLWDPDGIFLSGWVRRDHFGVDPCL